ncbi:MAG: hypothetical protein PHO15_03445 [Eubacteriales bacterium]|nr:hypothetical protein [Eubacteriales bacterium]
MDIRSAARRSDGFLINNKKIEMCGRYAFDDIAEIYEARKILEDIADNLGSDAAGK